MHKEEDRFDSQEFMVVLPELGGSGTCKVFALDYFAYGHRLCIVSLPKDRNPGLHDQWLIEAEESGHYRGD